jgi:hypothetical protein
MGVVNRHKQFIPDKKPGRGLILLFSIVPESAFIHSFLSFTHQLHPT